jgi:hypothetical protein
MIKKYLLVIAFSLLCVSSFAATSGMGSSNVDAAGFSKLSESEKAEILKIVADKAATKGMFGSDKESTEDKVDRWVKIGSNIGVGLGAAAKELNVAVNDFAKSPVGQLTTVLIA